MSAHPRGGRLLQLVGVSKILESLLLFATAAGALHLLHGNARDILVHWTKAVRIDPDNRFAHAVLSQATGLTPRKLEEIELGTILYGLLYAVEGTGLVFKRRWAEYVTVISTAGFLPLEIYEIVKRPRPAAVVVLILNLAILLYLVVRLYNDRKERK